MKKNRAIQAISALLAVLILLGAMPLSVFAAGGVSPNASQIEIPQELPIPVPSNLGTPAGEAQPTSASPTPATEPIPSVDQPSTQPPSGSEPVAPAEIVASGICGENVNWELISNGLLRVYGTGSMYRYSFPSRVPWYSLKDTITECTIEDGVTRIGGEAFYYCSSLTSITIPDSVTSIGNSAFSGCTGLAGITIPDSVTSIDEWAFYGCTGLTSITIPNSVTSIGGSAFRGCTGLTSITIPDSVTRISGVLFYDCTGLTNITMPSSVTSIGNEAFYGCTGLTSITIPSSVTSIGFSAFSGCTGLTSITIPDSVTSIGDSAFSDCLGLISASIGSSVESIGSSAFSGCYKLVEVYNKSGLTITTRSSGNGSVGYYALNIYTPNFGESRLIVTDNGYVFYSYNDGYDRDNYLVSYIGSEQRLSLPNRINDCAYEIKNYAFYECTGLTNITIPDSVTGIGSSAFYGCTGLTSITIPDSVTGIGSSAFYGCTNLRTIYTGSKRNLVKGSEYNGYVAYYAENIYTFAYDLWFALSSDGKSYLVAGIGRNSDAVVSIPHVYNGKPVTSICDGAFRNCTRPTNITIPDSVTSIGNSAFSYCSSLTSITIPDSVTSIGRSAFQECSGLTSITIPSTVTTIGDSAFSFCTGLTSITIPDSVTSIGYSAFQNCTGLTSVTIPDSVTSIYGYAFYGCTGLTSITIPNSVTNIGDWAFRNCTGLTSVTIPDGVTSIGDNEFSGYTNLTSITIPGSVTSIGSKAFYNCSSLTSITIPDSVTSIGYSAFSGCSSLESITLPFVEQNVATASYTNQYPQYPFGYIFGEENYAGSIEITQYILGWKTSNYYIPASLRNVTIAGGNNIPYGAFYNCISLTSITIGDSVTSIGNSAFYGCTGLTSITIPDSVTGIGSSAFSGCSSLESITLPFVGNEKDQTSGSLSSIFGSSLPSALKTVIITGGTSIGSAAFYNCENLTSITIPSSTISIGNSAFYGCTGLASITIPDSVTSIGNSAFSYCSSLTSITIPDSVTSIGSSTFRYCSSLTSITIPDSVTSIGNSAFDGCTGLTSITILDSVTSIGGAAFYGCTGLTSITIPNSVTIIGDSAFYGCTGLTSITIPDSVTSIGGAAFYGCTGLISITIPDSVTSIGSSTFRYCSSLTSITIPDSVTSIGGAAFYGCTGLTSITIPNSVTIIGNSAFYGCTSLINVYYYGTQDEWNTISIYMNNDLLISSTKTFLKISSGNCGAEDSNVRYMLYRYPNDADHYKIVISGEGELCGYSLVSATPWYAYKDRITQCVIGDEITDIVGNPFVGCTALTSITSNSPFIAVENGFITCNDGKKIVFARVDSSEYTVPNHVTEIGAYAFFECDSLEIVHFQPDSNMSENGIGANAFPCTAKIFCYDDPTVEDFAKDNGNRYISVVSEGGFGNLSWYVERAEFIKELTNQYYRITINGKSVITKELIDTVSVNFREKAIELVIDNGITQIEREAFVDLSSLARVTVGKDVRLIRGPIFASGSLNAVYFLGDIPTFEGNLFKKVNGEVNNVRRFVNNRLDTVGTTIYYDPTTNGWKGLDLFSYDTIHGVYGPMTLSGFTGCANPFAQNTYSFTHGGATYGYYRIASIGDVAVLSGDKTDQQGILYDFVNENDPSLGMTVVGFRSRTAISNIIIPDTVLYLTTSYKVIGIRENAFSKEQGEQKQPGVQSIESITVPAGIVEIQDGAFSGCVNLEAVYFIGNKPAVIGNSLFANRPILVHRADAVWVIGSTELDLDTARVKTAITLDPENNTADGILYELDNGTNTAVVGDGRNNGFNNVQNAVIADFVYLNGKMFMVVGFDRYAFTDKKNVKTVTFGEFIGKGETNAVPAVWDMTFRGMNSLIAFLLSGSNSHYSVINGMLCGGRIDFDIMFSNGESGDKEQFTKAEGYGTQKMPTRLILVPNAMEIPDGVFVLPDVIKVVERYAAYGNRNILRLDLSNADVIGAHAFGGCAELSQVNLGSVMFIEDFAFSETALTSVFLPEDLVYIGKYAFSGNKNDLGGEICIGKNIGYIGEGAFAKNEKITAFTVSGENGKYFSFDGALMEKNGDGTFFFLQYPAAKVTDTFTLPVGTVRVDPYAFYHARVAKVILADETVTVGRNAFENAFAQTVTLGRSYYGWTSVSEDGTEDLSGLFSPELFRGCTHLVNIFVSTENPYFRSVEGVLYGKYANKNSHILYCYPAGRTMDVYVVPAEITRVYDDAFRGNSHIRRVIFQSEDMDYIGSDAMAECASLEDVYFKSAPPDIGTAPITNTAVKVYYSTDKAEYWRSTWSSCATAPYTVIRELSNSAVDADTYLIVVTDTKGDPIEDAAVAVSLAHGDPANGIVNHIATHVGNGVYSFAVLDGYFDCPCTISVSSDGYFSYKNEGIYLDTLVPVTYVTLSKEPLVMGLSLDDVDINTASYTVNLASYCRPANGELLMQYDSNGNLVPVTDSDGNPVYVEEDVFVIKVVCYYDSGFYISTKVPRLLQQGRNIAYRYEVGAVTEEEKGKSTVITYYVKASEILPDEALFAEVTVYSTSGGDRSVSSQLNITVMDRTVDEDDLDLDTEELSIDLEGNSSLLAKLLGNDSMDVSLGKNLSLSTVVNGDMVTVTLIDQYKKTTSYDSSEAAYKALTSGTHNKETFFFQFKDVKHKVTFKNGESMEVLCTYNIRFIASPDNPNVYYYRLYIYSGNYNNAFATYYGVVNSKSGRDGLRPRAQLIKVLFSKSLGKMTSEEDSSLAEAQNTVKAAMKKGFTYEEPSWKGEAKDRVQDSSSFSAAISGELNFKLLKYGVKLVSGEIKGTLSFTYSASAQIMVWVIPVVLEVEVSLDGNVVLKLRFDGEKPISIEEAKMTLSAKLTASVGIGCKLASAGVYGTVGTVFVFEFYPDLGIESWNVTADLGVYFKILWYRKNFSIWQTDADGFYIIDNRGAKEGKPMKAMLYSTFLADTYSAIDVEATPEALDESAKLFLYSGEIYKVGFVNACMAEGYEGYDVYNCIKLALFRRVGDEWILLGLVDDAKCDGVGLNDSAFTLAGGWLVYTQQTRHLTEQEYNDPYLSAEGLSLKCVDLRALVENGSAEPHCIADGTTSPDYKYLAQIAVGENGDIYAVWAENSDNNILGVSEQNYQDESGILGETETQEGSTTDLTGGTHIFHTDANSLYVAVYNATIGQWQIRMLADGLSPITDIALTASGKIAFIVDMDSDLMTEDDRVLYHAAVTSVVSPIALNAEQAEGKYIYSVNTVFAEGNDLIYCVDGENGYLILDTEGAKWLPDDANGQVPTSDRILRLHDVNGQLTAILFVQSITLQEETAGSTVYGIFRDAESDVWGKPIRLYTASGDRHIQSFDGVLSDGKITLILDLVGADETFTSETAVLPLPTGVESNGTVDYQRGVYVLTVTNSSTSSTDVYLTLGGVILAVYSLVSGESITHEFSLKEISGKTVSLLNDEANDGLLGVHTVPVIEYVSLTPTAKHTVYYDSDAGDELTVAVTNTGNTGSRFTLEVFFTCGDIRSLSDAYQQAANGIAAYTETVEIGANGSIKLFRIQLNEYLVNLDEGIVVLRVTETEGKEPGELHRDNVLYFSLNQKDAIQLVSQGTPVSRILLDEKVQTDVVLTWIGEQEFDLVSVIYNGTAVAYTLDGKTVVIPFRTLFNAASIDQSNTLTLVFDCNGKQVKKDVSVLAVRYYRVEWSVPDQETVRSEHKVGEVMKYPGETPVKACTETITYVFVGWDTDGDGEADVLISDGSFTAAVAVFRQVPAKYTVTWHIDARTYEETYAYGTVPAFCGSIPQRVGNGSAYVLKGFTVTENGTDVIDPADIPIVTENVTYWACFETYIGADYCNYCGYHTPGVEATCTDDQVCTVCGIILTAATGHRYGVWVEYNEFQHKKMCDCGDTVYEDHTWNAGVTVTEPTATENGVRMFTCTACDKVRTETIPATGAVEIPENAPQLTVSRVKAVAGQTVTVDVRIRNNPGVSYLQFKVNYDVSALSLVSVQNGGLFDSLTQGAIFVFANTGNVTSDGILLTLTFNVSDGSGIGDHALTLTYFDANNAAEEDVGLALGIGTVEVIDFVYGDANGDGEVSGKDVTRLLNYLANYYDGVQIGDTEVELSPGADANGDGVISGKDVTRLLNYLANYYDGVLVGETEVILGPTA